MIRPRPHIADLAPYALADRGPDGATSLAQNETAYPPSPKALAAGQAALAEAGLYSDPDWEELRLALAQTHEIPATGVLCGAGSMELIACLLECFAGPGDEVLGTEYGYLYVASVAAQVRTHLVQATEPDLTVNVDLLLAAVTDKTRIVFLCNPGNPTGTLISNTDIMRLRGDLPGDILLVVDQAYGEFADAHQPPRAIFDLVTRGDTCVIRTMSKAYGLAGQRVGWGLFPDAIGTEIRKILRPGGVTGVSLAMAAAALNDQPYMRSVVQNTEHTRQSFAKRMRDFGINIPESHTNFVLLPFDNAAMCDRIDTDLRKNGFIGRRMGGYGLPNAIRLTMSTPEVMDRVANVIEGALQ